MEEKYEQSQFSASSAQEPITAASGPRRAPRVVVVSRRRPFPWVSLFFVFIFVAIEVLLRVMETWQEFPARFWAFSKFGHSRQAIWEGEYWRLFTCVALHGGALHLAVNAIGTFLFGRILEPVFGHTRLFLLYVLFGLCGSLAYQSAPEFGIGIGASGAVCGLIGVFLVGRAGKRERGQIVLGFRFWLWVTGAVALLLLDSLLVEYLVPGMEVADSAHFGGLAAGVFAGAYVFSARGTLRIRRKVRIAVVGCVAVFGIGFYGLAFPVFDWTWYLWRIDRMVSSGQIDRDQVASLEARARFFGRDAGARGIIARRVQRAQLARAWEYWKARPLSTPRAQLEAGDMIYDALHADGQDDVLPAFLDLQVGLVDQALAAEPDDVGLLNHSAWYRALRGGPDGLDLALDHAKRALELRPDESSLLNTLGWVYFKRQEMALAFKNLRRAVEVPASSPFSSGRNPALAFDRAEEHRSPYGANYLYLGLAYFEVGQVVRARTAAAVARQQERWLLPHELRMLDDLQASLGVGPLEDGFRDQKSSELKSGSP